MAARRGRMYDESRRTLRSVLEERGLLGEGERFVADLHAHSCGSDGSDDPATLAALASLHGLTHLAITNHDTTVGVDAAAKMGAPFGVRVIGGIEVSAYDFQRKRKVHVVGLDIRGNSPALEKLCAPTLQARNANTLWQLQTLRDAGVPVDAEKFQKLARRSTCAYKQHLMAAMTDAAFTSEEYRRLYLSLFKGDGICNRDIAYVDARDAVQAIREDGGVPVLAHPGQMDNWDFVPDLVECGLAGIERFHSDHSAEDEARALAVADQYGLFCSGGSDYHGAFGKPPALGCCHVMSGTPKLYGKFAEQAHQT